MPSCCIILTTDAKYMFPTLVSAISARQHVSHSRADVLICGFDTEGATDDSFRPACERENVLLKRFDPRIIDHAPAMMSRLLMDRFVPPEYPKLIYMDSDVLVTGPLDPLVDVELPSGTFLAANDPMSFLANDDSHQGRCFSLHLKQIGISKEDASSYFNSGVLRMDRIGWEQIGRTAWRYYSSHKVPTRYPDQDALNVAAREHRLALSLRWNYPVFMQNARVQYAIDPRIHHFMSLPKPWHGRFAPWKGDPMQPYLEVLRRYPALAFYSKSMPLGRTIKYKLQQRFKQACETVEWGFSERRNRILAYETNCVPVPETV
jgi:lipopolysaccharide biosynthesis glycosyltransferase